MQRNRLLVLLALTLFAAAAKADPVADSFARMQAHVPNAAPVVRPVEPADPLVQAMVLPLRDGTTTLLAARTPDVAFDNLRASFERMFQHEATFVASRVPAGIDPLIAALVEPLRYADVALAVPVAGMQSATVR